MGDCQNIRYNQLVPASTTCKVNPAAVQHRVHAAVFNHKPRLLEMHSSIINRKFQCDYITHMTLIKLIVEGAQALLLYGFTDTLYVTMLLCSGSLAELCLFLRLQGTIRNEC